MNYFVSTLTTLLDVWIPTGLAVVLTIAWVTFMTRGRTLLGKCLAPIGIFCVFLWNLNGAPKDSNLKLAGEGLIGVGLLLRQ